MHGLKDVRRRRADALARLPWEQLEALLAVHYRGRGYRVEHCGTGGTGMRFDGGIDLKLRRGDEYVLVQCKHWNARQVPHNAVHELLGLLVNERATDAVLVTSGEFTRAAIAAATRHGHVRLVDGDALRRMLGPVPDALLAGTSPVAPATRPMDWDWPLAGEGVLPPAGRRTGDGAWLAKVAGAALVFAMMLLAYRATVGTAARHLQARAGVGRPAMAAGLQPTPAQGPVAVPPTSAPMTSLPAATRSAQVAQAPPSAEEVRESRRRADEAIRTIEASTPEM